MTQWSHVSVKHGVRGLRVLPEPVQNPFPVKWLHPGTGADPGAPPPPRPAPPLALLVLSEGGEVTPERRSHKYASQHQNWRNRSGPAARRRPQAPKHQGSKVSARILNVTQPSNVKLNFRGSLILKCCKLHHPPPPPLHLPCSCC